MPCRDAICLPSPGASKSFLSAVHYEGLSPELFPIEILLGRPTMALSHSVLLQQPWKFGSFAFQSTLWPAVNMFWLYCAICLVPAIFPSKTPHPPIFFFGRVIEPEPASLSLHKKRMQRGCDVQRRSAPSTNGEMVPSGCYQEWEAAEGIAPWAPSLPLQAVLLCSTSVQTSPISDLLLHL